MSQRFPDPPILALIDEMRSSGSYEWADDTLTGIYDTVHTMGYVTEGQRRAVCNIGSARERTWEELDGPTRAGE